MAGKIGIAAKWFLGTTVLAAGGAGAFYGTTVGWPQMMRVSVPDVSEHRANASPEPPSAPFAVNDLDAVASAWAEPGPTPGQVPAESSATARTADLASVDADKHQQNDRYNLSSFVAAPTEVASTEPAEDTPPTTPAIETKPQPLETAEQETMGELPEVAAAEEPATKPAVARGQEPRDEPIPARIKVPQRLDSSTGEPSIASPEQQSASAFRDRPEPVANERYGSSTAPLREPAIVNPFHSDSSAGGSDSTASESIEPLPALPHAMDDSLDELPQTELDELNDNTSRAARAIDRRSPSNPNGDNRPLASGDAFRSRPNEEPIADNVLAPDPIEQSQAQEGTGRPGERALEGLQRPAIEIQKFAPGEIQVGKPAKFVVQLRNVSSQAADGVIIRDEVPQGTRLISTSPTADIHGSQITWKLDKLSPGEDRTVEMQLMPISEGEIGSVASVTYSTQASVKSRCTMPQLAIRMTAPEKVLIGHEQRVKIELRNPGSGDATGVMLFENVPQNVRHAAGPALEFAIGTLRAGEMRELELVLLAEKAGKTVNVLSARADGNLQVQQQVEFEVVAPALSVDVNGPDRRYLERPATYEVSVENPGTAPAHDVQIITKLPKGMQFVRANNLGEYDAATHAVYWSLAELPEGERGTVELVAMPIETGSQTLEVESRAGEGLADQTQRQIVVDGIAAIMFELRDLEDPIEVGGETGYEIRVVNQGTKAATNVQIAVNLPPGLQLVSAEGETQHSAHRQGILFDPISQLAPKADTVYRIRVQGMQPGDQRVTVEVNTEDIAQPIRREESTRVFGDE